MRVVAAGAVVAAIVAAHVWAAYARGGNLGLDLGIAWSSVWLWAGMAGIAGLGYGAVLAWSARHDQVRLEARLRRDGAP